MVEGARLESVCRGNSTVGSNPTPLRQFRFLAKILNVFDTKKEVGAGLLNRILKDACIKESKQ